MGSLLVKNAAVLATMDDRGTELSDAGLFIEDGWISAVGPSAELPEHADDVLDLAGHVVLPGMVNTHHHLYQTLTRAVPAAQDVPLFDWLRALYPVWAKMTPEHVYMSTQVGLAELALSGCTTVFDHHYLWPNGSSVDDQVDAAGALGVRFHVSRGSMSLGESDGGLPPDSVVETPAVILEDSARVVKAFHDREPGAMVRVVLAPCSPFSVTPELMRDSAELARELGVALHTHLAETKDEDDFCREHFGARPLEYAAELGWLGNDVWFAHAVHMTGTEVQRMARTGTGVAHCPSSNMRLASGIAPVVAYLDAGVRTGLGVDGSASNDSSHMLAEARQAMLLARLGTAPGVGDSGHLLTAREVLRMATRGGAQVLERDDLGSLEPGKAADFIAIDAGRPEFAGGADPIAALVFCHPVTVDHAYVHGRPVVSERQLVGIEHQLLVDAHRRAAEELLR